MLTEQQRRLALLQVSGEARHRDHRARAAVAEQVELPRACR